MNNLLRLRSMAGVWESKIQDSWQHGYTVLYKKRYQDSWFGLRSRVLCHLNIKSFVCLWLPCIYMEFSAKHNAELNLLPAQGVRAKESF